MDDLRGYVSEQDWQKILDFHRIVYAQREERKKYGVLCEGYIANPLEDVYLFDSQVGVRFQAKAVVQFYLYHEANEFSTKAIEVPRVCTCWGNVSPVYDGYFVTLTDISILMWRLS